MFRTIFKKEDPKAFEFHWEHFSENHHVSPRYTTLALGNFLEMSDSRSFLKDDWSFVLLRGGEVSAAVFLPVEIIDGEATITFSGGYVVAPLFSDEESAKEAFRIIDDIAIREKIAKIKFAVDALEFENYSYDFLTRYGYLNSSVLNYIIDLSLPGSLLTHCRKGHRSDIKKILNNSDFSIVVIDAENPDYNLHEEYRSIHRKAAGRVTRSKASFDSQFEKLKKGLAAAFFVKFKEKIIAASYFESHGKKVLYGSAAEDPEYEELPLYHSMVFSAMEYYQKKGFKWMEVSQPFNPSVQFDYYPDKKQVNIGLFKRGFGGRWVNDYRGIKYFKSELFKKDAAFFAENYEHSIASRLQNSKDD